MTIRRLGEIQAMVTLGASFEIPYVGVWMRAEGWVEAGEFFPGYELLFTVEVS